ncbi:MAG TPA: hypothetical protein PL048_25200 [Leptospiraceae bacterium]|nr:hypothetical protein [Leptospiraceae bacterium]HMY67906.1 hypothetical protein [Leptospiraceae bacterium]HMZ62093.1 hypothetical protein [Leptospiraceae bacterium]HNF15618.1 hypothetical protein [Leptospiraceae bacterium]HNF27792.1 hypothetical protein [Leptospiraceae bacterium]
MKFSSFWAVLFFFFHCISSNTERFSEVPDERKNGFRDIVRFKKGNSVSGVKAVETRGTVVVTSKDGESTVYNSREIFRIEKNAFDPESDSNTASSSEWSAFQGEMSWQEAKDACEAKEMRLPERAELLSAQRAGAWEHWKKDGMYSWYWSSEEYSAERAYSVGIHGESVYSLKSDRYHYVRCIRSQKQGFGR